MTPKDKATAVTDHLAQHAGLVRLQFLVQEIAEATFSEKLGRVPHQDYRQGISDCVYTMVGLGVLQESVVDDYVSQLVKER